MIKVGVIGLGMMGVTHLDAYSKRSDVSIYAVADKDLSRLRGLGSVEGNIEGLAKGAVDLSNTRKYEEGIDLINDPEVELVDICLPTPLHVEYAVAALRAGKHVLVEKPLARSSEQAQKIIDAAEAATGFIMPAMCMRFWPGWDWLKEAIESKEYGDVLSATFRRVSAHPGGSFYSSGEASGGGVLDLHIHDTDFVLYCFGTPKEVRSVGYSMHTECIDHVLTQYIYDDVPLVVAEGGWTMSDGFPFSMRYSVNFEKATADFDFSRNERLELTLDDGSVKPVSLLGKLGYDLEIDYMLSCIKSRIAPKQVTLADGLLAIKIVEAESRSIFESRAILVDF